MIQGIYEYCGPQRSGKSTLMVADVDNKILPEFSPDRIWANFRILIPGVHCLPTRQLIEKVFEVMESKERHLCFIIDEVSQFLMARTSYDKDQTKFATGLWQFPKRDILCLYGSNPGNSADVIMRLATWVTVVPRYMHGPVREDDYIIYGVSWNWDCVIDWGRVLRDCVRYQRLFDSFEPID